MQNILPYSIRKLIILNIFRFRLELKNILEKIVYTNLKTYSYIKYECYPNRIYDIV